MLALLYINNTAVILSVVVMMSATVILIVVIIATYIVMVPHIRFVTKLVLHWPTMYTPVDAGVRGS